MGALFEFLTITWLRPKQNKTTFSPKNWVGFCDAWYITIIRRGVEEPVEQRD